MPSSAFGTENTLKVLGCGPLSCIHHGKCRTIAATYPSKPRIAKVRTFAILREWISHGCCRYTYMDVSARFVSIPAGPSSGGHAVNGAYGAQRDLWLCSAGRPVASRC